MSNSGVFGFNTTILRFVWFVLLRQISIPYDINLYSRGPNLVASRFFLLVERILFVAGGTYSLLDLSMFECCLLSSRCSLWLELTIRTNGFRSLPSWDCEWVGVENPGQVRKREIISFIL